MERGRWAVVVGVVAARGQQEPAVSSSDMASPEQRFFKIAVWGMVRTLRRTQEASRYQGITACDICSVCNLGSSCGQEARVWGVISGNRRFQVRWKLGMVANS